eukprot:3107087-Prorocentrum_lima.AAC.1
MASSTPGWTNARCTSATTLTTSRSACALAPEMFMSYNWYRRLQVTFFYRAPTMPRWQSTRIWWTLYNHHHRKFLQHHCLGAESRVDSHVLPPHSPKTLSS